MNETESTENVSPRLEALQHILEMEIEMKIKKKSQVKRMKQKGIQGECKHKRNRN